MADRVDWQTIRDAYDDEDVILILNSRVAGILTSLWHKLEYEATYRAQGYDYADWDYLQRILADGASEVGNPMKLADLVQYIDQVETLLQQIRDLQDAMCCTPSLDFSNGSDYTTPVVDGVGDVPANIVTAGYASSSSDWTGYDEYKCMVAHLIVDEHIEKCERLSQLFDSTGSLFGTIAGIVAAVAATAIFPPGGALITLIQGAGLGFSLQQALSELLGDGLEGIKIILEANYDTLVCAIYESDGSDDAVANYNTALGSLLSTTEYLAASNMMMSVSIKTYLGGHYQEEDIADRLNANGYDPASYDCTCTGADWEYNEDWTEGIACDYTNTDYTNVDYTAGYFYGRPAGITCELDAPTLAQMQSRYGLADPPGWPSSKFVKISFDFYMYGSYFVDNDISIAIQKADGFGGWTTLQSWEKPDIIVNTWVPLEWTGNTAVLSTTQRMLRFLFSGPGSPGAGARLGIDNVHIELLAQ